MQRDETKPFEKTWSCPSRRFREKLEKDPEVKTNIELTLKIRIKFHLNK